MHTSFQSHESNAHNFTGLRRRWGDLRAHCREPTFYLKAFKIVSKQTGNPSTNGFKFPKEEVVSSSNSKVFLHPLPPWNEKALLGVYD